MLFFNKIILTLLSVVVSVVYTCSTFQNSRNPTSKPPSTGLVYGGTVTKVIDGDTLVVEVKQTFKIRLLNCWCAESRKDPRLPKDQQSEQKQKGLEAKQVLESLALGKEVVVQIPTDRNGDISKSITLDRFLGNVWLDNDHENLSQKMVELGVAYSTKDELIKSK